MAKTKTKIVFLRNLQNHKFKKTHKILILKLKGVV
jgi:hypothetical protein